MGTIVLKNAVVREPGFMYYISASGDLCKAKMVHGGKGRKKKVKPAKSAKPKQAKKKTVVKKKK